MSALISGPLIHHDVVHALNVRIGKVLKVELGQEAPLPAELNRLMLALRQVD